MITRHNLRISLSLVGITLFIIFIAHWLGIIPSEEESRLRARIGVTESLAVFFTAAIQQESMEIIPITITAIVERNPEIESIILRKQDGATVTGGFNNPVQTADIQSTPDLMKVPIFKDKEIWGLVEVGFLPLQKTYLWGLVGSDLLHLIVFVVVFGLVIYMILVSKVLQFLDPYRTVPGRVKTALNALTEGVVLIDDEERIVLSNEAFEKKFQFQPQMLLGKTLSSLAWVFPEKANTMNNIPPWRKVLDNRKASAHMTLQHKINNDVFTIIVNSAPLHDKSGKIRGVISTFSDVTELALMNQELESMAGFLRHEAGNALLGATGTIKLLEESEHLNDDDKQLLHRAQRSHRVIQLLLDSVREAKTIKSSFEKESTEPVRLDTLVADTVKSYTELYKEYNFLFESDKEELMILGQEERIIQMLDKLVSNALDYSNKYTPIIISCNKNNEYAVLTITNQGEALPKDKQKIFDLFASFRKKTATRHNQGIGLYVVKLIAEAYGGSVEARDRQDIIGAEFIIKLPVI